TMTEETTPDQQPEDKVGYARPPKHTQFKAGKSGNPKGRPKGSKGMKTILRKELGERVEITENGRKKRVTKQEMLIKRLTAEALKGDMRAIHQLSSMTMALLGVEDERPASGGMLSRDDQVIVDDFLMRMKGDSDGD
ncbi:MAG: DUF5681 domain-containing protein, partial [Pseudomonadota bacterium]